MSVNRGAKVEMEERRKRLGQYFTGIKLARLLAALSVTNKTCSILDPMVGSGDMLVACNEYDHNGSLYGAIEIDPVAHRTCVERIPWSSPVLGSAFSPQTLALLPLKKWDLVITNPPYVRYQSLKGAGNVDFHLPSGAEVRKNLLLAIDSATELDNEDKRLFGHLVSEYSGLSDLAVPAWILCAAMCAPEGRLALVVPESWLSRDYASIIQYIILRWFKIHYVIEDTHAAWFEDAQVKTTLIVAERIERKNSAFNWSEDDFYLRLQISKDAIGKSGIVDRIFEQTTQGPEEYFAGFAARLLSDGKIIETDLLKAAPISLAKLANNFQRIWSKQKWLGQVEERSKSHHNISGRGQYFIPDVLETWLLSLSGKYQFSSLETIGVRIGQGLRTGANFFFYGDLISRLNGYEEIEMSLALNRVQVKVPESLLLPVLRKQNELPDGYLVDAKVLKGRVLDLRSCALIEDIKYSGGLSTNYTEMPTDLAGILKLADEVSIKGKKIRELSAVAPNIRSGNPEKGILPKFWYMLPDFAPRHHPDLLIPRVNNHTPRTYINVGKCAIVDANFSTIWLTEDSQLDVWGLLALFNSAWFGAVLEFTASVMGGGALKVEASHIRRIPIPILRKADCNKLSKLGGELSNGSFKAKDEIDKLIVSALLGRDAKKEEYQQLRCFANDAMARRDSHEKRRK